MDLRRSRRKNEYKELQLTLTGMGIYEEGMELLEMRQVLSALQRSASENDSDILDGDMQQALRESELDFAPNQDGRILNSTMMSTNPSASTCNSPDIPSERIVVEAQVHHAMDWVPTPERFFSASSELDVAPSSFDFETYNEILETDARRVHESSSNETTNDINKARNLLDPSSFSSMEFIDFSENSSETSTTHSHDIHAPISEGRLQDSGLFEGYKTPQSSYDNSSDNLTTSNTTSNNRQSSVDELPDSIHEVHGPVSVRRVVDSGLNLSSEIPRSSSFERNSNENSISSVENSTNHN